MENQISTPLSPSLVLKLLRDASAKVIGDVARQLYADDRMASDSGLLSIREYCAGVNIKLDFDDCYNYLLDANIMVTDMDANFALAVAEHVCTYLYENLEEKCKSNIGFLKILLDEDDATKIFGEAETLSRVEIFQAKVRSIYKGVEQVVGRDLSKNLLTIDQMANNILTSYKQEMVKQKAIAAVGKNMASTKQKTKEPSSNKLWRRNSKLKVSIIQEAKPVGEVNTKVSNTGTAEKSEDLSLVEESYDEVDRVRTGNNKRKENRFNHERLRKDPERIQRAIKEVKSDYERLHKFNAGSWYRSPSKVSPKISGHLSLEEIFTNVRLRNGSHEVDMNELLTHDTGARESDENPPLMLIQGLAGSGKTSLCYHLASGWKKNESDIKSLCDFDLVILIESSRVRSNRLKEFLRDEFLPASTADMDCDDIIPWLKTHDVLFIFDGYFEIESVSYDIIEDVLAKFSDQRIIITTRPEVHKDFEFMARRHSMDYSSLELCGFDVPRLKDFTHKVFKAIEKNEKVCKEECEKFLSYINGRGRVLDKHLKLPLTILLLAFLWKKEPDILNAETTATQLYEELYILYFYILAERTSKYFRGVNQVSDILTNLLLFIGEKAWTMVKEGTTIASSENKRLIREECEGKGIRSRELLSTLHMLQIDNNPSVCNLQVAFQHNTQMYYLAATYLVDRLQRHVLKLQEIDACPGVEHVLMFIMGHLAYQNALTNAVATDMFLIINNLDIDPTKYEFWWSMLLESRFQSQVAFHIAKEKLPQKHWQLNEVNVVRGLKLLALTPIKLWSLIIDIPDKKEPYDIPEFLESLMEAGRQIKKRQKRIVRIDLHLRHHEKNSIKTSDDFLRALHPWSDLQTFTGHLGSQDPGEEIFATYANLSIIHIKLSTMDSFHSLSASLKKIQKTVKTLHVTIALPKLSPPDLMTVIKTSGNLEISVADMEDQHREWLVEVINKVCGRNGCWRLNLTHSHLTYDTVEWLVHQLQGKVQDKVNVETSE